MWPIWWQLWHTTFLLTLGARLSPLLHQHTNTLPPLRALEGLVAGLAALVAHALTPLGIAGAIASLVASLVANVALHLRHHFRQQASYLLLRMNKL